MMMQELKRLFLAGIATILPLLLTLYIVIFLFNLADDLTGTYLAPLFIRLFGFSLPGMGVITLLLLIVGAGYISTRLIGKWLFNQIDRLFHRIPVLSMIYPSVKQLSDFLFAFSRKDLKKVVYIEFPYHGSYSLAFTIKEDMALGEMRGLVNVFVPFAPTPLSGLVMLVPADKVHTLDVPVEEAIRYFVTAGVSSGRDLP